MANPILKHYATSIPDPTTSYIACMPSVPVGRVFVVAKLCIMLAGPSRNMYLWLGPGNIAQGGIVSTAPATYNLTRNMPLNDGENYTETGLVVLAGEQVALFVSSSVTNLISVNIFGEELDNV